MNRSVLDASALLALLLGEPGADRVKAIFDGAVICAVNVSEIVGHFAKMGADQAAIETMLSGLPVEIIPADTALSYAAGMLRPRTAHLGLSMGDRYCLALAKSLGAKAVTADRAWAEVAHQLAIDVVVIR
jgi:ribonuclease VapC